jgi:hypothetical protein
MSAKPTPRFPDSQKTPFGPAQLRWLDEHFGRAFFRKGFTPCERAQNPHEQARAP